MNYAKLIEITQRYIDAIVEIQTQDSQKVGFILTTAATASDGTFIVSATNLDLGTALSVNLQVPGILAQKHQDPIGETKGTA